MILDLSVFQPETLDITMMDGTQLHIPKPDQGRVIELIKFRSIKEDTNAKRAIRALNDMTALILNSNTDGISIQRRSIEQMSVEIQLAIVNAYTQFILKLQSNPT